MQKITYLFGAGASAYALPIVKKIPDELGNFLKEMKREEFRLSESNSFENLKEIGESKGKLQRELYEAIEWAKKEAEDHASIDTFAKKLYVTGEIKNLTKLKTVLTCFFNYIQLKNSVDYRYDSFFAALINAQDKINPLPSTISILSWNYDFQFEKAYTSYSKITNFNENQIKLNIHPREIGEISRNVFSIFKLNSTAVAHKKHWEKIEGVPEILNIIPDLSTQIDKNLISNIVMTYAVFTYFHDKYEPSLTFAWENTTISKNVIQQAIEEIKESNVLVVIGYSFPYFNREIDRYLISAMKKLEKVYFQAPEKSGYVMKENFKAIKKDIDNLNLEVIEHADQFFLPPEL